MKCFIWENLRQVTEAYHSNGGLIIFAASISRAKELASADENIKIDKEPDDIRECDGAEGLIVFPDAGCAVDISNNLCSNPAGMARAISPITHKEPP